MGEVLRVNFDNTYISMVNVNINKSIEFLHNVYVEQGIEKGDYFILNVSNKNLTGNNKSWEDIPFRYINEIRFKKQLKKFFNDYSMEEYDLYFTTSIFINNKRRISDVKCETIKLIAADLDNNFKIDKYKPYLMWESSKGSYQAIFKLGKTYSDIDSLKRVVNVIKSEVGGDCIDLSRVLRIPGTINHKPGRDKPIVTFPIREDDNIIASIVKELSKSSKINKNINTELNLYDLLSPYKISRKFIKKFTEGVTNSDRSEEIFNFVAHLKSNKIPLSVIIEAYKLTAYKEKYLGREDIEISRIYNEKTKDIQGTKSLEIKSLDEMLNGDNSEKDWLIDKLIYKNSVGMIAGDEKTLKTTLALDIAYSVATGKDAIDTHKINETGKVLYISLEGSLTKTIRSLNETKGYTDNIEFFTDRDFTWEEYAKLIEERIDNSNYKLIVIDPLILATQGDIHKADEIKPFLKSLLSMAEEYKTTFLIVHHNNRKETENKAYKISGSSHIPRLAEFIISLERLKKEEDINESDEDINGKDIPLKLTKYNYRYEQPGYSQFSLGVSFANNQLNICCERFNPRNNTILSQEDKVKLVLQCAEESIFNGSLKEFSKKELSKELSKTSGYSESYLEREISSKVIKLLIQNKKIEEIKVKGTRGKSKIYKAIL